MSETPRYEMIIYWSDADKAFIAEVPELPGCAADGATYEEAVANARVIIDEWIETGFQRRAVGETTRLRGESCRAVIHTGFWGCGAFGGNRELMPCFSSWRER